MVSGRELSIIEVGTSAGLNLIFDYYCYNYGGEKDYGAPESQLRINCFLKGECFPCTDQGFLNISERIGVDLNTIDVGNPEDILWLRALIWPEHGERVDLLLKAISMAKDVQVTLKEGDAVKILPEILPGIPEDTALCIFHTYTINQFSQSARENFESVLRECGSHRDLFHLSCEWGNEHPQLELESFHGGEMTKQLLAYCDLHGKWIEWLYH